MSSSDLGKTLLSLSDVEVTDLKDGHIFQYRAATNTFVNVALADGGGTVDPNEGSGGLTEAEVNTIITTRLSDYLESEQITALINSGLSDYLTETQITALINSIIASSETGGGLTEAEITTLINNSLADYITETQITALINSRLTDYLTEAQIMALIDSTVSGGGGFSEDQITEFINTRLRDSIGDTTENHDAPNAASYNLDNTNNSLTKTAFPNNGTITLTPETIDSLESGDDLSLSFRVLHNIASYTGSPPVASVAVDYLDIENKLIRTDTVTLAEISFSLFSKKIPAATTKITFSYAVSLNGVAGTGTITISNVQIHDVGIIEDEIRQIANEESSSKLAQAIAEINKTNNNVDTLKANAITATERQKVGFVKEFSSTVNVQQPENVQFETLVIGAYSSSVAIRSSGAVNVRVSNTLQGETVYLSYTDTTGAVVEYEIKPTDATRSDTEYFYYTVSPPNPRVINSIVTGHTKETVESLTMIRDIAANKTAIANIPVISEDARDVLRKISAQRVTNDEGFKAIHNPPLPNTYPILAAEVGPNPPNQVNQYPIAPLTYTRHNFYHDITVAGNKLSGPNKLIAVKVTQGDVGEGNDSKVLTIGGVPKLQILRGVLNTFWQRGDGQQEIQNYIETIRTRAGTFRYTVPIGHVNNFEYDFAWHITEPRQYTVRIYASPSNPVTPPQYDNAENQNELEINIPDLDQDVQLAAQNIYFHELDRPSYIVTVSYNAALGDIEVDVVQDRIYAHLYPAYFAVTAPATRTVVSDSTTYPRIFDNASTYLNSTVHNILVAIYKKANGKMAISGYVNNIYIPELEYPYQQEGNFDFSNFVIGDRDGFHFISDVQILDIGTIPTEEQLRSVYAHFDQLGLGLWEDNVEELDSIDIVANEIRLVDPDTGTKRPIEHQEEIVVVFAENNNLAISSTSEGEPLTTKLGGINTDLLTDFAAAQNSIRLEAGYFYDVVWHTKRTVLVGQTSPTATDAILQVSTNANFLSPEPSKGFDTGGIAHNNPDRQPTLFTKIDLRDSAAAKYIRLVLTNPTDAAINVSIQESYLEIKRY